MAQAPQQGEQQQPQSMVVFEGFTGLNTQPSRYGVGDKECFIMDGFFPAGADNARVIPDLGPIVFGTTNDNPIVFFDFVNIGVDPYALIFLADGSVVSMATATGIPTTVAPAGTIQNPAAGGIGVTQWGSSYAQIVASQTDGYFVYSYGGWYGPGDTVPGTGAGVVPTGISGTAIETYQSRVWIANGQNIVFSAPGSIVDFTSGSGGGGFASNDPSLRVVYTQLKAANGYLYVFGDSSLSYIANPQTTGSPLVTTFSFQNADPEVGTAWPGTVDVLGSNIVFANAWGAQVSLGGRVAKISSELDGVYGTLPNFGGRTPSAAKAILFGRRVWALLLPVIDQVTGQPANKLFIWDEKRWCSTSQSTSLTFIQHQEIASVITAWGTDGTNLYRLFQTPSTGFTKTMRSKLWAPIGGYARLKGVNRLWGVARLFQAGSYDVTIGVDSEFGSSTKVVTLTAFTASWINNANAAVVWRNNAAAVATWGTQSDGIVVFPPNDCGQAGALVGITVQTTAADLAILSTAVMPVDVGYRG